MAPSELPANEIDVPPRNGKGRQKNTTFCHKQRSSRFLIIFVISDRGPPPTISEMRASQGNLNIIDKQSTLLHET